MSWSSWRTGWRCWVKRPHSPQWMLGILRHDTAQIRTSLGIKPHWVWSSHLCCSVTVTDATLSLFNTSLHTPRCLFTKCSVTKIFPCPLSTLNPPLSWALSVPPSPPISRRTVRSPGGTSPFIRTRDQVSHRFLSSFWICLKGKLRPSMGCWAELEPAGWTCVWWQLITNQASLSWLMNGVCLQKLALKFLLQFFFFVLIVHSENRVTSLTSSSLSQNVYSMGLLH